MTTLVARQPLQTLSMSNTQRAPRRLSARLQEKEDIHVQPNGYHNGSSSQATAQLNNGAPAQRNQDKPRTHKKRKIDYDEDDDGFVFSRAKARQPRVSSSNLPPIPEKQKSKQLDPVAPRHEPGEAHAQEPPKKRRNKMSFSTPKAEPERPLRRSKRLSDEAQPRDGSPQPPVRRKREREADTSHHEQRVKRPPENSKTPVPPGADSGEEHSATKISLPFADTPVIRKNKAMRQGKGGKGERRSSLGMRGRRASSLIESGNSNALPHSEVHADDFYKHIESDGLTEPRRMRQLLTWCATRALEEQSRDSKNGQFGSDYQSAHMAARIIQKELLKDFANRSEMSDWFAREDVPEEKKEPLPERPNPKNEQNAKKIHELEERIERLKSERQSLEALLRPPSVPSMLSATHKSPSHAHPPAIDSSLLSPADNAILNTLQNPTSLHPQHISARLNQIGSSLGPTIDAFADGINMIAVYRDTAERVSGRVLKICAARLEARDQDGRKRAIGNLDLANDIGARDGDLTDVLRSLSKIER